ncbi:MAG TPA: ABC transporter permease [Vicinamibacteria bacterium]|nr:ABC transporter permease [Vicinamibacteria bacterium]
MLDALRQDASHALRRLRQAPGFTLVAVATLALGIGATSAIFSVVNAVLLRPLPVPEPDRLVRVAQTWKGRPAVYSPQNFLDVEAQATSFSGMAAIDTNGVTLTGQGTATRLEGASVSASFFDVLRVRPLRGRGFLAGENEPGRTRVAVLGYPLWRDRFGADPGVVGRTVSLNRQAYVLVGVAPPGFRYPEETEIWTPMEYDQRFRSNSRGAWYLSLVGRLREGATVEGARQEVSTIADRLARAYPADNEGVGGTVIPLLDATVGESRRALLVLLGAVGLVLLVACVNVANLLLARIATRETELALRSALGAGRGRLVRQLLTESLVLAVLGGGAGLLLSVAIVDGLLALQPQGVPRLDEVSVNRAVVGFAAALSLLTTVLFGAFPALQTSRRSSAQALRQGSRGILTGRRGGLRGGLVVGQIALALVLVTGSALLLRSFARLRSVDPGFRTENALAFRVSLPDSAYSDDARLLSFHDELQRRLGALPGVSSVGAVVGLPLTGRQFTISFTVDGRPEVPPAQQPSLEVRIATPAYFRTIGIPVKRGRGFTADDGPEAPQVVLLSESAVRRFFADEEPIGKTIRLGLARGRGRKAGGTVVGIVGDVKELGLGAESPPEIYVPYAQFPIQSMEVVLRTDAAARSLAAVAERVVHGLDPELPVARVATLDEVLARSVSEPRFYAVLLGSFAGTALFLAALGLFGVTSYSVTQRTRELAVRIALGARREELLRMVLREALLLAGAGVAAGLAGALLLSRVLSTMLYSLSPRDPLTLGGVALLLLATTLLAGYLPARRATRVDPAIALRAE